MIWSPLEVVLILFLWFPLALAIILTPYLLTILSINALAGGSYAITQGATERGSWFWFAILTTVFTVVVSGGILLLLLMTAGVINKLTF